MWGSGAGRDLGCCPGVCTGKREAGGFLPALGAGGSGLEEVLVHWGQVQTPEEITKLESGRGHCQCHGGAVAVGVGEEREEGQEQVHLRGKWGTTAKAEKKGVRDVEETRARAELGTQGGDVGWPTARTKEENDGKASAGVTIDGVSGVAVKGPEGLG